MSRWAYKSNHGYKQDMQAETAGLKMRAIQDRMVDRIKEKTTGHIGRVLYRQMSISKTARQIKRKQKEDET